MEDEIKFPHLTAVLKSFADELGENYAGEIERNKHNASHALSDAAADPSLHKIVAETHALVVTFDLPSYWKYIEHGTRPHWPPYDAIRRWIDIKPVIPRPGKNGRIPTPAQLTYLIRRKIATVGTTGTGDLATARDRTLPWWMERIREALGEDLKADLDAVLLKGLGGRVIEGRL